MIVCHCNCVNDKLIRDACKNGADSLFKVVEATNAGTDCANCHSAIQDIIDETLIDNLIELDIDITPINLIFDGPEWVDTNESDICR